MNSVFILVLLHAVMASLAEVNVWCCGLPEPFEEGHANDSDMAQ